MPNNKPEVISDGILKAKIWTKDSEKGPYHNITLSRTYKDQDGNYQESNSFNHNDLLAVSELARDAYNRVKDLKREHWQSRQQEQPRNEACQAAFKEKRSTQGRENRQQQER